MSIKNDLISDKESKSSKIIIISKGRLSSAQIKENYMTLQDGEHKLTIKIKNDTLSQNQINKAISSLKNKMLKKSKSSGKMEYESKNISLYSQNKNKNILKSPLGEKEKDSNNKKIKKVKLKSILSVESTTGLINKSKENNKSNDDENENELKIKKIDLLSSEERNIVNINNNNFISNKDLNNNMNNNKDDNKIIDDVEEEDTININIIKNENVLKNNSNNKNKIISQNFFNNNNNVNESNSSKKAKNEPLNKYYSEEIKFVNKNKITEEDKNNENNDNIREKNIQPSEITTKSILGSMIGGHIGGENTDNNNINLHRLMTENEVEEGSGKISVKSKNDLISGSKSIKIDENENEEDEEYEEVEDEYDEKIKDDNNRKIIINSINITNNNNLNNININAIINNQNVNENFQKIKNDFNNGGEETNDNRVLKSLTLPQNIINQNIYKMCNICEHSYPLVKLFVADCHEHYLCKRCTKNYYEEIIEDGRNEMCCPFLKCKAKINLKELQKLISPEHYKRLINTEKKDNTTNNENGIEFYTDETSNNLVFTKLKTTYNKKKIELYTKKHVIDINTNKTFFNYNKEKEGYCPFCLKESLFTKTNTHYYKCLNCICKICRYCSKEFIDRHMDIHNVEHCKVYYRLEGDLDKRNILIIFLLQLFFVFACFYLTLIASFYYFRGKFLKIFNTNINGNYFLIFIAYFLAFIIFVITVPFVILLYPYFPSIIALFDY